MNEKDLVSVQLSPDELRYLISCGAALAQNIPEQSLPTYCHFTKAQILAFSARMRSILQEQGLDL